MKTAARSTRIRNATTGFLVVTALTASISEGSAADHSLKSSVIDATNSAPALVTTPASSRVLPAIPLTASGIPGESGSTPRENGSATAPSPAPRPLAVSVTAVAAAAAPAALPQEVGPPCRKDLTCTEAADLAYRKCMQDADGWTDKWLCGAARALNLLVCKI